MRALISCVTQINNISLLKLEVIIIMLEVWDILGQFGAAGIALKDSFLVLFAHSFFKLDEAATGVLFSG